MRRHFDTRLVAGGQRVDYWHEAVCSTYFPLALDWRQETPIEASLAAWEFQDRGISLSSLESIPTCYSRSHQHIASHAEPCYLVTIPFLSGIYFEQDGKSIRCAPGHFIIERSDSPYRFGYSDFNRIMVLKVPDTVVRERVGNSLKPAGLSFDSRSGLGRLFVEQASTLNNELDHLDEPAQRMLLDQVLDSFCLIVQSDSRVLSSESSGVTAFHLNNIERFILRNLSDADLSPEKIAEGCGLSVRYLYKLLAARNLSPTRLLYQKRLDATRKQLSDPRITSTIGEIAFAHGFNDQAHFSRAFRARFSMSPSEFRKRQFS